MHTAYYVKWVLENVFNLPRENIVFLTTYFPQLPSWLDYDGFATKDNVRHYIKELNNSMAPFIYVISHGGGFNGTHFDGGRWDDNGDEGTEHYVDGQWKGVDEGILLAQDNSTYWDDEFREDIEDVNMTRITVMIQTCRAVNGTEEAACYSGGFIDDLSSTYYRTVITSSNETGLSYYYPTEFLVEFTAKYMEAFSDYKIIYDGPYTHFDTNQPINWPYKSWRGAFEYVLLHDCFYLNGMECPWFDDDGDGLPTYVNGTEVPDFPWNSLDLMRWLKCDINYDGKVDMKDIGIVCAAYGSYPGHPRWNRQADVCPFETWTVDMQDVGEVCRHYGETT